MAPALLHHGEEVHRRGPGDVRRVVFQEDVQHLVAGSPPEFSRETMV